ncbi:hypothetical protein [Paracidovorax konjaci]|uniref:Uncharacterized protein n=1 Tax=Paracidovorax konjaci TaxID=32040 RepID=A0A1I1W4U1_9BURK|nr:hypothetical protein [Paracidovorax konjaci]SFD90134.1 hypothetical protein SAMN04489710_108120 [Paracidovorax konjaci]
MGVISRTGCACLVAVSALAIGFAAAAGTAVAPADQAVSVAARTPYPAIDPAFSRPDPWRVPSQGTLRTYLVELESFQQANTFCFVQQRTDSQLPDDKGASVLWMIWHEGASIQKVNVVPRGGRYRSTLDPVTRGHALAYATGRIHLETDVVPNDEDVGSSTFLVGRLGSIGCWPSASAWAPR